MFVTVMVLLCKGVLVWVCILTLYCCSYGVCKMGCAIGVYGYYQVRMLSSSFIYGTMGRGRSKQVKDVKGSISIYKSLNISVINAYI